MLQLVLWKWQIFVPSVSLKIYVDVIIGIKCKSQKEVRAQQLLNICGVPQWLFGVLIDTTGEKSQSLPEAVSLPPESLLIRNLFLVGN